MREGVIYPGHPGATVGPKGNTPCRFECLEIFIWLEEGAHAEGIDEAKE
jgi:hypothetical protein